MRPREVPNSFLPVTTAVVAAAVFIADQVTEFQVAVPALYVTVVILASRFLQPRGIVLVTAACVGLALLSAATSPIAERASPDPWH